MKYRLPEAFFTAFIILMFCLTALSGILYTFKESRQIAQIRSSHNIKFFVLHSAYDTLLGALQVYLSGSKAVTKDEVMQQFLYLRSTYERFNYEKLEHAETIDDIQAHPQNMSLMLDELQEIIENIQPSNEKNKEIILMRRLIEIDEAVSHLGIDEFHNALAEEESYRYKDHKFLRLTVFNLAVSGLSLIMLLLWKLHSLDKVHRQKQAAVDLLHPRVVAIEAALDGIAITDRDGNIMFCNKAFAVMHGYDGVHDLEKKSWKMLYDLQQSDWFEAEIFPELLDNCHWHGFSIGQRKDGSHFHQDISLTRITNGGRVMIVRDYTNEIQAAEISSKRLAAIEAAGDGIGIVDSQGLLTYANTALMLLHGLHVADMNDYIGHPWVNLYSDKGRNDIEREVMPYLRQNGHWKGEASLRRQDGRVVFAEMSLTRLPDGGLIGTARDITDRKQVEQEKERLQRQFFQSQKMEAIGRLAGGIAHDFNNILASIMGYAEFLTEDLDPENKQHKYAKSILSAGAQAKSLVEQILTFSRHSDPKKVVVNIRKIVDETVAFLQSTLPSTVNFQVDVADEDVIILANTTQIGQTVMNLCVNAIDAMDNERGILNLRLYHVKSDEISYPGIFHGFGAEPQDPMHSNLHILPDHGAQLCIGTIAENTHYACLEVKDSGCGMVPDVMERIFEPFYTTKPMEKGTGLGLATVHGIVAVHNGAMVVTSALGKGTTFALYFPILMNEESEDEDSDKIDNFILGDGSILIVEDQEEVANVIGQMLERFGYKVHIVYTGDQAIEYLRIHPDACDLVLSDESMPRMKGSEMAAWISVNCPRLPVILLSGHDLKSLEVLRAEIPAICAVLRKPVEAAILSHIIAGVLTASESGLRGARRQV